MLLKFRTLTVSKRSVQQLFGALTHWEDVSSLSPAPTSSLSVLSVQPSNLCLGPLPAAHASMALLDTGSKSTKRKAAEALLQSRFQSPDNSNGYAAQTPKRRHFCSFAHVRACSASADEPCSASGWCDFDVSLPHLNWNALTTAKVEEVTNTTSPHHLRLPKYQLPYGIDIYVVERSGQIPEALRLLRESMEDNIVSIDLEWKPDFVRDTSKVALMQLASATCCILIRSCKLKHVLPEPLLEFLR